MSDHAVIVTNRVGVEVGRIVPSEKGWQAYDLLGCAVGGVVPKLEAFTLLRAAAARAARVRGGVFRRDLD